MPDLDALIKELDELEKQCKLLKGERDIPALDQFQVRVQGTRSWLRGEQAWMQSLWETAEIHFRDALKGDQASQAQQRLNEIAAMRQAAKRAEAGLDEVEKYLEREPPNFVEADKALSKWKGELPTGAPFPGRYEILKTRIRESWSKQIVARLERLKPPLPRPDEIIQDVQKLQELLGRDAALEWEEKLLPHAYKELANRDLEWEERLSPEKHGELKEKDRNKALRDLGRALHYCADEQLKAELRDKRREAHKRLVRAAVNRLRRGGATDYLAQAESLATQELGGYDDDPEVRLMLGELCLEHGKLLGRQGKHTAAVPKFAEALRHLNRAAELDRAAGGHLAGRIREPREEAEAWKDISQSKANILQYLQPDRSAQDLRYAVRDLFGALCDRCKAYKDELDAWLETEKRRIINALETKLEKLSLDDQRGRWGVILALFALDEHHPRASQGIDAMANQVSSLRLEVSEVQQDKAGPKEDEKHRTVDPKDALEVQICSVRALRDRVVFVSNALDMFNQVFGGRGEEQQDAGKLQSDDDAWLENLIRLQGMVNRFRAATEGGCQHGNWEEAERRQGELEGWTDFWNHRTVEAAVKELRQAKKDREHLDELTAELQTALAQEDFQQAQKKLRELKRADKKYGFGFCSRLQIEVTDMDDETVEIRGEEDLRDWLWPRLAQWRKLEKWWAELQNRLDWAKVKGDIEDLINRAAYDRARSLCRDALIGGATGGWTNEVDPVQSFWALRQAKEFLAQEPDLDGPPLSRRVRDALAKRGEMLARVRHAIAEAEKLPARIERNEKALKMQGPILENLQQRLAAVAGKRRREEQEYLYQQIPQALEQVHSLAPGVDWARYVRPLLEDLTQRLPQARRKEMAWLCQAARRALETARQVAPATDWNRYERAIHERCGRG